MMQAKSLVPSTNTGFSCWVANSHLIILSLLSSLSSSDRKFPEQDPLGTPPRYSWHYRSIFFLGAYSRGQRSGAEIKRDLHSASSWLHHTPLILDAGIDHGKDMLGVPARGEGRDRARTASHKAAGAWAMPDL